MTRFVHRAKNCTQEGLGDGLFPLRHATPIHLALFLRAKATMTSRASASEVARLFTSERLRQSTIVFEKGLVVMTSNDKAGWHSIRARHITGLKLVELVPAIRE